MLNTFIPYPLSYIIMFLQPTPKPYNKTWHLTNQNSRATITHMKIKYNPNKPIILDLFCGAGGASYGYYKAGYQPIGVDNNPHQLKRYPFPSILGDVFTILKQLLNDQPIVVNHNTSITLKNIAFIHASPPCQGYIDYDSRYEHPRLIKRTRNLLIRTNLPYVIENVDRAPLIPQQTFQLCGTSFNLQLIRHRKFEFHASLRLPPIPPCAHSGSVADGTYAGMYGHGMSNGHRMPNNTRTRAIMPTEYETLSDWWREASGNYWMHTRHQLKESIPWAYTYYIGSFIKQQIN